MKTHEISNGFCKNQEESKFKVPKVKEEELLGRLNDKELKKLKRKTNFDQICNSVASNFFRHQEIRYS